MDPERTASVQTLPRAGREPPDSTGASASAYLGGHFGGWQTGGM